MERSLTGTSALITGSTQGIGLATARRLAEAGCNILLSGLGDPADLDAVRARLAADCGVRTMWSGADLRKPPEIAQMVADGLHAFGSIDILVNNAVVRHAAPVEAFTPADWDESVAVNLSAAFHTIRLVLPSMKARRWGRIINVSSIYGLRGAGNRIGYVATKTALIGLTRAVALETVADGITCNAVCPGTTDTPVHEAAVQGAIATQGISRADAERTVLAGKQPTGRFVAPGNITALIAFLCGPDAADITGAALPVDGGWSIA